MFLRLYLIALPVFFLLDMLWLGLVARNFYQSQIGFLLRPDVNWVAAIIFYLLFILGMVVFVIHPAYIKHSWQDTLMYGVLFGLITYATYDLTNLATMKDWPLTVTIVDLLWGAVLSLLVSFITYSIANKAGL